MQGVHGDPQAWDDYIFSQFVRPLSRYYQTVDTVILAFDNYKYVPKAKCMTQTQRRKHVPSINFTEGSMLPPMVPDTKNWMTYITNRAFKAKVVDLVITRLPRMILSKNPTKKLVIDYDKPVEHMFYENEVVSNVMENLAPMGEADVKFTRYADIYDKLIVDSIDGDSIPIALVHHELRLESTGTSPRVSVYRMELKTAEDKASKKRDQAGTEKTKPVRAYEYVDIQLLYEALKTVIRQCTGTISSPSHNGHEIRMLTSLIALTGTDFSRGLPQMSGKTVYDYLAGVWMALVMAYDPLNDQLIPDTAADRLVALIYYTKFTKHVKSASGLSRLLDELSKSSLAQRTKESLPNLDRILCTVKNVNWVLKYWTCEDYPDPVQPMYGYSLGHTGAAIYAQ